MTQISGFFTVKRRKDGVNGVNTAPVILYQRMGEVPDLLPGTLTYTFATASISGSLNGWRQSIPNADGDPCYVITAVAVSNTPTATILSSDWSTVRLLVSDGANGTNGTNGLDAITIEIDKINTTVDAVVNTFDLTVHVKVLKGTTYMTEGSGAGFLVSATYFGLIGEFDDNTWGTDDVNILITGFTADTITVGTILLSITIGTVVTQRVITVARNNKYIVAPRGLYNATAVYVGNAQLREVVKYGATHYITKTTAGTITAGTLPTNTTYFEVCNSFENIATGLLFAENGFIGIQSSNKIVIYDADNNIVGGMTGEGIGETAWRFWLGGSTPATSPTRITQGGKTYLLDAVIEGILRTAESGARIEFSKAGNSINIFDASGLARLMLAPRNVIPFADLTGSADTTTTTYTSHSEELEDDAGVNIGATETLELDPGKYYDIATPAVDWELAVTGYYDGYLKLHYPGVANVSVTLFDVTNNRAIWTTGASVTSDTPTEVTDFGTIASHTVRGVQGSTFRMDVVIFITHAYPATGYATASIATGATLTGTTIISFAELGWNGFNFVNDLAHLFHYGSTDGLVYKGAQDMPGVLASGSIDTDGSRDANKKWGAKISNTAITKSTGTYTVPHGLNHTNYMVYITPRSAGRTFYISAKASTTFTVIFQVGSTATDTAFDYVIVGDNT